MSVDVPPESRNPNRFCEYWASAATFEPSDPR